MPILIRYFAALRETVGRESETIPLPDGTAVEQARSLLIERYPALASILPRCAVAVNRVYVTSGTVLASGDELAFIPPLGGG